MPSPKFDLGRIVATPAALEAISSAGQSPEEFIRRHASGDWGEVDQEDWGRNDRALNDGSRLMSAYRTASNVRIWVISEAVNDSGKREATTIILPHEY